MVTQDVQFREWVYEKKPPRLSTLAIDGAIMRFLSKGHCQRKDVAECIMLANALEEASESQTQIPQRPGIFDLYRSDTSITEDVLLETINDEVKQVRLDIFGKTKIPFRIYQKAVEWIETEEQRDRAKKTSNPDRLFQLVDQLRQLADEITDTIGRPAYLSISTPLLQYYKPGKGMLGIKVKLDSKLLPLHAFAQSASSSTGFSEEALVSYALTGIHPRLARITVGAEISSGLRPPKTTITILAKRPSWKDLRSVYQLIKEETKIKRPRLLDETAEALVSAIHSLGGVPRRGKTQFWGLVQQDLAKCGIKLSIDAIRMRFHRLPKGVSATASCQD
jgi:hypothetical protein